MRDLVVTCESIWKEIIWEETVMDWEINDILAWWLCRPAISFCWRVVSIFHSGDKCWKSITGTRNILHISLPWYHWTACNKCSFGTQVAMFQFLLFWSIKTYHYHSATCLDEEAQIQSSDWWFQQFWPPVTTQQVSRRGLFSKLLMLLYRESEIPVAFQFHIQVIIQFL